MIQETGIIPEYIVKWVILMYPQSILVDFKKAFEQKKPLIIPHMFYENRFITDFTKRAELFNSCLVNNAL